MTDPFQQIVKDAIQINAITPVDFDKIWRFTGADTYKLARVKLQKVFEQYTQAGFTSSWDLDRRKAGKIYLSFNLLALYLYSCRTPVAIESEHTLRKLVPYLEPAETLKDLTAAKPAVLSAPAPAASAKKRTKQKDPVVPELLNYALKKHEVLLQRLAAPETGKPEKAKPKTTNDEISVFMFPVTNQPVRIVDQSGGLWFIRNDVCDALGHKNPSQATATHCKPEGVQNLEILTQGGIQNVVVINEANLNRLIMRSKVEHAIQFQDWVCEEVIPSIRKTGGYNVNPITQLGDILDNPALNNQLMLELTHRVQKLKQENQIQAQDIEVKAEKITQLEGRVEELLPAEKALELLADDPRAKTLTETAGRLRMRLKDLTRFMCQNGWIYKTNYAPNSGEPWLGYRQKLASGLLIQSNYDRPTEYGTHSHYGVKVTQKGLIKLAKLLNIDLTKLSEGDNNSDE